MLSQHLITSSRMEKLHITSRPRQKTRNEDTAACCRSFCMCATAGFASLGSDRFGIGLLSKSSYLPYLAKKVSSHGMVYGTASYPSPSVARVVHSSRMALWRDRNGSQAHKSGKPALGAAQHHGQSRQPARSCTRRARLCSGRYAGLLQWRVGGRSNDVALDT